MPPPGAIETPIRAVMLVDQVIRLIKEQIGTGILAPGDRIVEQPLARKLKVGQNVVREALIQLAHSGYVRRVPNRGTYVTKFTVEETEKIAAVRRVLEHLAIDLVLQRSNPSASDFLPMRAALARMKEAARTLDRDGFADSDIQFHRLLWDLTGNEFLTQSLENLVAPVFAVSIVLSLRLRSDSRQLLEAVAIHESLTGHLEMGEEELAHSTLEDLIGMSLSHYGDLAME